MIQVDLLGQRVEFTEKNVGVKFVGDLGAQLLDGCHDDLVLGLLEKLAQ